MRRLTFAPDRQSGLRLLVVGAHADDIEIGCGGTILRLLDEGVVSAVRWVVMSAIGPRDSEARAGAEAFLGGVGERVVEVHGFRDGYFPYEGAAIKDVFEDLKAGPAPDLILTHRREDLHQDHRLVAELAWNTFRDHAILEFEIPKYDGDLGQMNVYVELGRDVVERKINLLGQVFASQADRRWFSRDTFHALLQLRGVECNSTTGFAEAFMGRKLVI